MKNKPTKLRFAYLIKLISNFDIFVRLVEQCTETK